MKICVDEISIRFLAGQLNPIETAEFEKHLEVCSYCVARLEAEAGGEVVWQTAKELLAHENSTTGVRTSSVALNSDPLNSNCEWMPGCTTSVVLSILFPSDDPEFVGRIGTYEVSGVVGRGSAGIVLRGFDRALNRNVAIKVLDPSIAGVGAARQRFAREARSMAALSHEHVVSVYEVNEHNGLPFFVMEYVPGGSLERRLQSDGTFDVESVVRIGLQTAQALAAAHSQGLVHRDIKPGNVLLDRGTERIRVADFGLVRVANDVSCTRSGFITGTPQYMAPEQVRAEICDARSDLFSLGSLMYALCTGHPPFRADSVYAVMQRIVHDSPRSIRAYNPQIPEWLDEFILRLLSKAQSDRFASADEVVRILQRELSDLQDSDSPGMRRVRQRECYSLARIARKRRRTTILMAGIISALLFVLGLWAAIGRNDPVGTNTASAFTNHNQTESAPNLNDTTVPSVTSWDRDEIPAIQQTIQRIDSQMHSHESLSLPDTWEIQVNELRRRMSVIATGLENQKVP